MQVQKSEQTFYNFLILWKSRFPPKKVLLNQLRREETFFLFNISILHQKVL